MPSPDAQPNDAKRALREQMRAVLAALPPGEAATRSRALCRAVAATGVFQRARTIMAYLPIETPNAPPEVDPRPLGAIALAHGKRLCYPCMDWDAKTMQPISVSCADPPTHVRRYEVPEPIEGDAIAPGDVDLVIVPGVAFDAQRRRLGRGAGFYDRFLATWRASHAGAPCAAIGVGFAEQIVERVPVEAHDIRLEGVACEAGLWLG